MECSPCEVEDELVEAPSQEGRVTVALGPRGLVDTERGVRVDGGVHVVKRKLVRWNLAEYMESLYPHMLFFNKAKTK